MADLISLVYVSTAYAPFSDSQLTALLARSRENNSKLGLTGLLIYNEGQFMQALEGPEHAVRERYDVIASDRRHGGLTVMLDRAITKREFAQWTMGFRSLTSDALRRLPGYHDVFDDHRSGRSIWGTASRTRWLLDWFRDQ